jgi:hypothetical protein
MLEYSKIVLEKVSFNRDLFKKELEKSKRSLKDEEILLLQHWCTRSFQEKYPDILGEAFGNKTA